MNPIRQLLHSHPHWGAVQAIYHRLFAHGYKAFLAGGCVRDALLGIPANDLDIATDATPDQIEQIFTKTVAVGKSFGVMRVIEEGADIEVATFRTDGSYKDGRRPDHVTFTTPEEDADRRDFTVNALFFDLENEQILDFVEGQKDLSRKIVRAVGDPHLRFQEDQLRLLRGARFAAQLDFSIEEKTLEAMTSMAPAVHSVSGERIRDEMGKLLKSKNVSLGLQMMEQSTLLKELFPWKQGPISWSPSGTKEVWKNLSLFLRDADDKNLKSSLDMLKLSVKERRAIEESWILWRKPAVFLQQRLGLRLQQLQKPGIRWALEVLHKEDVQSLEIENLFNENRGWGETLPRPFLNGEDLKGKLQGEAIGRTLQEAYNLQLEKQLSTREAALEWLAQHLGSHKG